MKLVSQQSLDIANLESLGTRLLTLFDNHFEGNELDRTGKLYEFLDQMRDNVISSNKSISEDSDNQIFASINAHSKIVEQANAKIAVLSRDVKETEEKYQKAKKDLEKHIAMIKELQGKIITHEKDKLLLSRSLY